MKRACLLATILALGSSWVVVGCRGDSPPAPPRPSLFKRLKTLAAEPGQERHAATAVEVARVLYMYQLNELKRYYDSVGNVDKLTWADREIKNLSQARVFEWQGLPAGIDPPPPQPLDKMDERMLVERAVGARRAYQSRVDRLLTYYERHNEPFKAKVIRNMAERLDPIRTYMYFLGAEIPPADIKTNEPTAAADGLYFQARELHEKGKGFVLFRMGVNYRKQRNALALLQQLIREYPNSTRAPEAAFFIAEIYKEYFDENLRAVHWYERAWQWDPNITQPARFQAAVIHDLRLHNVRDARRCYEMVIQYETSDADNVKFARKRLRELPKQLDTYLRPTTRPTQPTQPTQPAR